MGYGPWGGERVGHDLAKKHQQLMDPHSFDKYFLSFYFMAVSLLNIRDCLLLLWASLVAQRLKCLTPMQETRVRSLCREDPLEKEMATHSSILAWRISWTEEPGRLQSMGSKESDTTERLHFLLL